MISLPLAIWAGSCSKLTDVNLPLGSASASAALPVQVVDTLRAGDTFIARTLISLLRGEAPQETLSAAAQAAAEACTRIGGLAMPLQWQSTSVTFRLSSISLSEGRSVSE